MASLAKLLKAQRLFQKIANFFGFFQNFMTCMLYFILHLNINSITISLSGFRQPPVYPIFLHFSFWFCPSTGFPLGSQVFKSYPFRICRLKLSSSWFSSRLIFKHPHVSRFLMFQSSSFVKSQGRFFIFKLAPLPPFLSLRDLKSRKLLSSQSQV